MEKIRISRMSHIRQDDFDELNIHLKDRVSESTVAEVADDEHNAFLQVNPESTQVVGATIIYADDWFTEIADAFQRGDGNHPDVKFFLEQKIREWVIEREGREQTKGVLG